MQVWLSFAKADKSSGCYLSAFVPLRQNHNFLKNLCEFVSIRGFLGGTENMANIVFSMLLRFEGSQIKKSVNNMVKPSSFSRPDEKKKFVRDKFSAISGRYDLLNSMLSLQIDRYWRWKTTRLLRQFPSGPILDLCAGTLPLALELTRQAGERRVLAVDFCEDMLRNGKKSLPDDDRKNRIFPVCGDGEEIPAPTDTFYGCTVAFGVRNLARTLQGLQEMYRVLRPGGKLLILEFSRPTNPVIKPIYSLYLNKILPFVAGLVSGDKEAYEYLASSIAAFYEPEELLSMMRQAGFTSVRRKPLTFGIVSIYIGRK